MHVALTIAGSDSGGGAGIQADLKTFARYGVYGTSAITAITAQNTRGVAAWESVSPELVRAQIDAVMDDLAPKAIKTGMLGSAAVTRTVIDALATRGNTPLIVDPVMVASSGDLLLDMDAVAMVRDELIRLATLVTPNLDEARVLLGRPVETVGAMRDAARDIVTQFGAHAALVKGGHLTNGELVDVLYDGEWHEFVHPRIETTSTHGTGCTLSAAIAAGLTRGDSLYDAVQSALQYVHRAIATAPQLGSGHGPLNHFA